MNLPIEVTNQLILGVDIGGANLKYADINGRAFSVDFPLWMRPDDLADQLASDLAKFPGATEVVATMTGELADCFLDRAVGVRHITEHLRRATFQCGLPDPKFYGVDGDFCSAAVAMENVDSVAASNWHALASFVAQDIAPRMPDGGLLVDIGSTTTDLIPLRDGKVATTSRTDFDRLTERSLVYLGGGRTPVCSLVDQLEWKDRLIPVMREVFATMSDARLLMGFQSPDPSDLATADGKPRDAFHAANRIARMIGLDHRNVSIDAAIGLARQVHASARDIIGCAIAVFEDSGMIGPESPLVVSGHGEDLLPKTLGERDVILLGKVLGDDVSRCAPAYSVATLFAR